MSQSSGIDGTTSVNLGNTQPVPVQVLVSAPSEKSQTMVNISRPNGFLQSSSATPATTQDYLIKGMPTALLNDEKNQLKPDSYQSSQDPT